MRLNKWAVGCAAGLAMFSTYMALDTFVISEPYTKDATMMNMELFADLKEAEKEYAGSVQVVDSNAEETGAEEASCEEDSAENQTVTDGQTDAGEPASENRNRLQRPGEMSVTNDKAGNSETSGKRSRRSRSAETTKQSDGSNDTKLSDSDQTNRKAQISSSEQTSGETEVSDTITLDSTDSSTDDILTTLTEYRVNDTTVYVADIRLSSAEYLKTAFANDTYGRKVTDTTSGIAAAHNAKLAINGDYYGARETGYVIRNGIVYRSTSSGEDVLCIYADGHMEITDPSEKSAEELVAEGVWQAFSFGPALLENGEISVSVNSEVGQAMASNPRTAVGILENNHFVFVVSDGRTEESEGLSLYEMAEFLKSLGVKTAYNLDGGGSSTLYYDGEVINNPTTGGNRIKERSVSDIVYIG